MSKKIRIPQKLLGKTVLKILTLIIVASFLLETKGQFEAIAFKNLSKHGESYRQKEELIEYPNAVVMSTSTFISGTITGQTRSQTEFVVIKTQADKNPGLEYNGKYVIIQVYRSVRHIPLYQTYLTGDVISVRGKAKSVEKEEVDKIWEGLLKGKEISEEQREKMEIYDSVVTIIAKLGVIDDLEQEPKKIFYLEAYDIKVVGHIDRSVTEI